MRVVCLSSSVSAMARLSSLFCLHMLLMSQITEESSANDRHSQLQSYTIHLGTHHDIGFLISFGVNFTTELPELCMGFFLFRKGIIMGCLKRTVFFEESLVNFFKGFLLPNYLATLRLNSVIMIISWSKDQSQATEKYNLRRTRSCHFRRYLEHQVRPQFLP